jgi:hypothetical protein
MFYPYVGAKRYRLFYLNTGSREGDIFQVRDNLPDLACPVGPNDVKQVGA